jgi:type IV pilus assembly protein PilA
MGSRRADASRCSGFTVIELVTVVAVTAIVVAVGYSAYRTYAVRAEVAEGIALARRQQELITIAFHHYGGVPTATTPAELSGGHGEISDVVKSITLENGRIDVLYGGRADEAISGRRLSLSPYETATLEVVWVCGNEIAGPGLHPLGFAGGGPQAVQVASTVEARFLPAACR